MKKIIITTSDAEQMKNRGIRRWDVLLDPSTGTDV